MFPKVQDSKKYKKDLMMFQQSLKQCPKEYAERMSQLIHQFTHTAEQIDLGHDSGSGGIINPKSLIRSNSFSDSLNEPP